MKHFLLVALMLPALFVSAQSNMEEIEFYQSIFGMEKKEITAQLITPSAESKDAFWALYDEYESARKEIGQKRIALIQKYAASYTTLNEENVTPLVKEAMSVRDQNNKLIKTYYGKISKSVDPVTAAQFYQLEHYFLSELNVAVYSNIPMVGELKK